MLQQRVGLVDRVQFLQLQVHRGVAGAEAAQDRRQDLVGGRGHEAHRQPAGHAAAGAARGGERALHLRQHAVRLVEQHAAWLRQLDLASRALEQHDAELFLERADHLAKRRLRHVQPVGGAAKAEFLRHGDELAQLAQVCHAAAPVSAAARSSNSMTTATQRSLMVSLNRPSGWLP